MFNPYFFLLIMTLLTINGSFRKFHYSRYTIYKNVAFKTHRKIAHFTNRPYFVRCRSMAVLTGLIVLALVALFVVSAINRKQEREQLRRTQQRKLKLKYDALVDIVNCLEQTLTN